jgi:N-acetylmuramoyl-L-alanine amidase
VGVRRALFFIALILSAAMLPLLAQQAPSQQPPPLPGSPQRVLSVVVLDPAHGGTDPGARGANGAVEKDIALTYARAVRAELERQGFRVVLTRDGDQNPSFDDRAAIANALHNEIFISLHVSSTGPAGTARVYSYEFSQAPEMPAPSPAAAPANVPSLPAVPPAPTIPLGIIPWEMVQKPFVDQSRRLANVLQSELSRRFAGSPQASTPAAVRGLRSVTAPAVAVEISSVTAADQKTLEAMAPLLATAIARAVTTFKPLYEAGTT